MEQLNIKIDAHLLNALKKISYYEKRTKSYYIREGLKKFIKERLELLENQEDLESLRRLRKETDIDNEESILFDL